MKTYFKHIFLVFAIIGLTVACNTTSEKKEDVEKELTKIEENLETTSSTKTTAVETSPKATPEKDKFTSFMHSKMNGWKSIPQSMWLKQDYITNYNTKYGIEEKIDYAKNTSIKGDFNGDGFSDHAQFLQNPKKEVVLVAFHQTEDGYHTFEIANYGILTECCLGAGISVTPPGIYTNIESNKDNTIQSDGIIYSIYEKTERLWHFDGKKYTNFIISD